MYAVLLGVHIFYYFLAVSACKCCNSCVQYEATSSLLHVRIILWKAKKNQRKGSDLRGKNVYRHKCYCTDILVLFLFRQTRSAEWRLFRRWTILLFTNNDFCDIFNPSAIKKKKEITWQWTVRLNKMYFWSESMLLLGKLDKLTKKFVIIYLQKKKY